MKIIIDQIVAHVVEARIGFTYSTASLDKGRAIIWEVRSGDYTGLGECRLRGVKSKTRGDIKTRLKSFVRENLLYSPETNLGKTLEIFVKPLLGQDACELDSLLHPLPTNHRRYFPRWVREGLSIALFDLVGKVQGRPVYDLLGGARRHNVAGMPVIHVSNTDKMRHWAELWLNDGYRHLKIKARGDLDADVAAIAAIRKVAGRDVMLQVDANGGYGDIESGERAVRAMQAYDVDCYEDMAVSSLSELAQMRKRTGACIMVDGLSYWPGVQKVIEAKAADVINHHPNNQGGLGAALLINSAAIGAGIETAVGSSGLFGVQDAAFQMLSSVIGLGRPCEDIGLVPYYSGPTKGEYDFEYEPSVIKESYVLKNGTIEIPDAGGLGIELDERKLKGLRKEVYRFSL